MIRIVVLGSGGAVPSPDRNLCSIALKYEGDVYLFDCAEGTQKQMMKYGISYAKVKAIFLTHLHGDHIFGIPGLVHTLKMIERKEKLLIFGPIGTKERVCGLLGGETDLVEVAEVDRGWKWDIGNAEFITFRTIHTLGSIGYIFREKEGRRFDKEKCTQLELKGRAFRIIQEGGEVEIKGKRIGLEEVTYTKKGKKIVYTGDTAYSKEVVEAAVDADILFHDATFMEEMREKAEADKHSTVIDAAKVAKEANAKKLVVFHLSNRYKNPKLVREEGKKEFEEIEVAHDGMEILI